MKKSAAGLSLAITLLLSPLSQVLAADTSDVASIQDLVTVFSNAVKALVELAGVVLFIMLVIGGFKLLISGGDQKKLESAKGTVTNAIIGLVVIVVAFLILQTIKTFTGVDVTKFEIPVGP